MKTESENEKGESAAVDQDVKKQLDQLDGLLLDFKPEPEHENYESNEAAASEQVPDMETGEMVTALLTVIFSLMAGRRGDHWALSDAESEMLGNALAAVLDKYVPNMKGGPEATLIVVVLVIVGPRAMEDRHLKAARAQERAAPVEKGRGDAEADSKSDASDLWVKEAA